MNKINFEILQSIYQNEKTLDGLQPVPQDLYEAIEQYAREVETTFMACRDYKERDLLQDIIHNARMAIDSIRKYREHKILEAALLAESGCSIDQSTMTTEEKKLYTSVLSALHDFKNKI
jgi:DNA replication initiation complex subunit (GINS family)